MNQKKKWTKRIGRKENSGNEFLIKLGAHGLGSLVISSRISKSCGSKEHPACDEKMAFPANKKEEVKRESFYILIQCHLIRE